MAKITAFKDRRSKLLGGFAALAALGAIGYAVFGGSGSVAPERSAVRSAPSMQSVQGMSPVSNDYKDSIKRDDQARVTAAENAQGPLASRPSATPTLVLSGSSASLPSVLPDGNEQAPAAAQRPQPVAVQAAPVTFQAAPVVSQARQQADKDNNDRFKQAVEALRPAAPVAAVTVVFGQGQENANRQQAANGNAPTGAASFSQQAANVYQTPPGQAYGQGTSGVQRTATNQSVPYPGNQGSPYSGYNSSSRFKPPAPGSILYSYLLGRVNTDTPGPVVAELLQGPFSGARLLGNFQFSEQGAVLSFNTMSVNYKDDDGVDQVEVIPIKAVAVDEQYLGTAMATDINRHLWEKIGSAFVTSFMGGLGQAVAQSGSTAVIGNYGTTIANPALSTGNQLLIAGGAGAAAAGQAFQQIYGNRRTTITVDGGTPFGLLFLGQNN